MNQRFTRREVARIVGTDERRLRYWERLRLVTPRPRWGERFYSFGDLVAVKTIKQLTESSIPARRLRRALEALGKQLDQCPAPLAALRIVSNGRQVVVVPPAPLDRPIEPLSGQLVLDFETRELDSKVRAMTSRTAEEWFELALSYDTRPETFAQAADAYRRAIALAPDWVEAHINLGATLFQLAELEEAVAVFHEAIQLDPQNPTAHFNLGCVLFEMGALRESIAALQRALELAPQSPDTHLNLALAYEKANESRPAAEHWKGYLQLEPNGPWADYARARLRQPRAARRSAKVTEFHHRDSGAPSPG